MRLVWSLELGLWLWLFRFADQDELVLKLSTLFLSDASRDAAERVCRARGVCVACVSRGAMFLEGPRMMMMKQTLVNGRASDANQALEYSLAGDVILRHRNEQTEGRAFTFIHVVFELRRYCTREELHANSIYQLDLHNNRSQQITTDHNGFRRTRSREAQGCSASGQRKPTKHSLLSI